MIIQILVRPQSWPGSERVQLLVCGKQWALAASIPINSITSATYVIYPKYKLCHTTLKNMSTLTNQAEQEDEIKE